MSPSAVLLATRSPGKLRELRAMFAAAGISTRDLEEAGIPAAPDEDDIECFETFEENAMAKARYFHRRTGAPVVADDSGLEVAVLGGMPGVRSRRWSGRDDLDGVALDEANNRVLLAALQGKADRRARYVCVAAYCDGDRELTARGEAAGLILEARRGEEGFGYDPYFYSLDLAAGFGEVGSAGKERVSHRGRAMRALIAQLSAPR